MRQLLIILTILLLSSPVIGDKHEGLTLYQWKTFSGLVWKGFGEKDTNPKYQGYDENGKPSGLGVLTFPDGSKYLGHWKDGKKDGQGTFIFSWGGKYEGEYKDGEQSGHGTETYPSGNKYVGQWKDGRMNGQGTFTVYNSLIYQVGRKYVGEYRNGKEWNGTYYDNNGGTEYKLVNGEIE